MIDLDDLTSQLRAFGDALVFDDADLADTVLARIEDEPRHHRVHPWLVAAAAVLVLLIGVALIPDSRRAVARWLMA